jgi:uncharacterized membrane protein
MYFLMMIYVGTGLLLSAISIPLALRKIGPNPLYGFRVKQTLEDPQVWYDANAHAGKGLICVGLISAITALALTTIPGLGIAGYALSCTAVISAAMIVSLVLSFRYLERITRAKS